MNISYRKAFLLGLATVSFAQASFSKAPDRFSGSPQSSFTQQTVPRQSFNGQQSLRDVKVIFVDSLGNSNDSQVIRDKTINRLVKAGFSVANQPEQADAVLAGTAF